jgi:hypothetical protein
MRDLDLMPYFFGLTLWVHIVFAVGVFLAARNLRAKGERVRFAPPIIWAILTLLWGMCVLLPYWLIHHSTLRATREGV